MMYRGGEGWREREERGEMRKEIDDLSSLARARQLSIRQCSPEGSPRPVVLVPLEWASEELLVYRGSSVPVHRKDGLDL